MAASVTVIATVYVGGQPPLLVFAGLAGYTVVVSPMVLIRCVE